MSNLPADFMTTEDLPNCSNAADNAHWTTGSCAGSVQHHTHGFLLHEMMKRASALRDGVPDECFDACVADQSCWTLKTQQCLDRCFSEENCDFVQTCIKGTAQGCFHAVHDRCATECGIHADSREELSFHGRNNSFSSSDLTLTLVLTACALLFVIAILVMLLDRIKCLETKARL